MTPVLFLYLVLLGLVLHAAWTDWTEMKILNATNISIVCAAAAKYALMPETFSLMDIAFASALFAFGIVVLHVLLKFGAGDIKFMGAIALWFGQEYTIEFALISGMLGGVLAIAHIMIFAPLQRLDPWGIVDRAVPFLKIGGGKTIPYGVGMAPAALLVLFWEAQQFKVF